MIYHFSLQKVSILVLGLAIVGYLSGCKHSSEERVEKGIERIVQDLNLTPDQRNEIEKYKKEGADDLRGLKANRLEILTEIENELATGQSDSEKIKRLYHDQSAKRDEVINKWIEKVARFQETLSSDQKKQLLLKIQKIKQRISESKKS